MTSRVLPISVAEMEYVTLTPTGVAVTAGWARRQGTIIPPPQRRAWPLSRLTPEEQVVYWTTYATLRDAMEASRVARINGERAAMRKCRYRCRKAHRVWLDLRDSLLASWR